MGDTSDHILLTEERAAVILQPHMRNKSAAHWLENDRRYDPVIPFHYLQGQPYYLESDLVNIITKALNAASYLPIFVKCPSGADTAIVE